MCLIGCKSADDPNAGDGTTGAKDPVSKCTSCVVTISPNPAIICGTGKKTFTATADQPGGAFDWSSSDTSVLTVAGSGKTAEATGVATGKKKIKVTFRGDGCTCSADADVTVCVATQGRHYANAKKSVADAIGVSAKIKTRYGKLSCEDEGCKHAAYHVVYVNVTGSSDSGDMIWAQTGYGRERTDGDASIKKYRYAEMNGDVYKVKYDSGNPPAEGSSHVYQVVLNKSTGTWSFFQDGTKWKAFADDGWKHRTGNLVQWTGEIFNKEDDMPGTSGDKCTFTECKTRVDGHAAFANANIQRGEVGQASTPGAHDSAEWGEEYVSGTAINIWDKNPLP